MHVGIIGAGGIANKVTDTLQRMEEAEAYAIASRSLEKAEDFARRHGVPRAYGSYEALLDDPEVDLVYVTTPHSHHFDITRQALLRGKPCLVEKAFMANAAQTRVILDLAREKNVFVGEAIWTRYQPAREMVRRLIDQGRIGPPRFYTATLAYSIEHVERLRRPELCGGALLDVGVYGLNFVRMFCDSPIESVVSQCVLSDEGVDLSNTVSLRMENGAMANIDSSAWCCGYNLGVIAGPEGSLVVNHVNNPMTISVTDRKRNIIDVLSVPERISGYEYQFQACRDAIGAGLIEPPQMPHSEILYLMELMDRLRGEWGVHYPMDDVDWRP